MLKTKKKIINMKPHNVDCISCRVNDVQQHNVPKRVEEDTRIKHKEVFGGSGSKETKKKRKNKKKKSSKI